MKIEMDVETKECVVWVSGFFVLGAVLCTLIVTIIRYNSLAYEKGYTQVQLIGTQQTMWVIPNNK